MTTTVPTQYPIATHSTVAPVSLPQTLAVVGIRPSAAAYGRAAGDLATARATLAENPAPPTWLAEISDAHALMCHHVTAALPPAHRAHYQAGHHHAAILYAALALIEEMRSWPEVHVKRFVPQSWGAVEDVLCAMAAHPSGITPARLGHLTRALLEADIVLDPSAWTDLDRVLPHLYRAAPLPAAA